MSDETPPDHDSIEILADAPWDVWVRFRFYTDRGARAADVAAETRAQIERAGFDSVFAVWADKPAEADR